MISVENRSINRHQSGHDTTSSTLTFVFYLLAKFQAVQLSAQQYLDKVLSGRDPSFEDVMQLDYIANILKEAMRMYPAVSFLIRIAQKSFEWKGYKIPKGVSTEASIHND